MTGNPPTIDASSASACGQRAPPRGSPSGSSPRGSAGPTPLANYEEGRRPLRIAQLVAIAAALGRSPAAFLVDLPEAAAVIERIDGDLDRCLQVAFILDSLDSEAEAADDPLM
jgi:transcriptional regulator with XRE-family HTH domain